MIPGLLHGRLLGVAPAGAIILHPAYPAMLADDTEADPATATATATFTVSADGTWSSTGTGHAAASGLWYNPPAGGVGAAFDVRITPTLTSGSACVVTNPAAGWVALSADRTAQFVLQMLSDGTLSSHYSILVEMRPTGGGATVSSNTFTLVATAKVTSVGGGATCVCDSMFIRAGLLAKDARAGDLFDCLDLPTRGREEFTAPLQAFARARVPCVRLTTVAGAVLECSKTTPFDLLDGRSILAPAMLGEQVVTDWGIETVASVEDIGIRPVRRNHLGGISYAAGTDPQHRIYSHNSLKT